MCLLTVKTQQCSEELLESVTATVGDQPILRFNVSKRDYFDSYKYMFQIYHKEEIFVMMRSLYFFGQSLDTEFCNCKAGPDTDVRQGIIDIQLNNVTLASRGTYVLKSLRSPSTAIMCVKLKVLGK